MYRRRAKRTAVWGSICRYSATTSGPMNGSSSGNSNLLQFWQSGLWYRLGPPVGPHFPPAGSGLAAPPRSGPGAHRRLSRGEGAPALPEMCRLPGIHPVNTV